MINLDNRYNFRQVPDFTHDGMFYFTTDITSQVRELFGDVVKTAQQIVFYGRESDHGIECTIEDKLEEISMYQDLCLSRGNILVKFSSEKVVAFVGENVIIDEAGDYSPYFKSVLSFDEVHHINKFHGGGNIYHYSLDITDKLESLFGDVLVKAEQFVLSGWFNAGNDEGAFKLARKVLKDELVNPKYGDIVLTFTGGNSVQVNTGSGNGSICGGILIGGVN